MTREELYTSIQAKKSYLCVGLDTDLSKIPKHLLSFDDPIFEFNKRIIDATSDFCVAYKPNIAFYEALGPKGWESLAKTLEYIPKDIFTIADAKRGDIGNTSKLYAKTFFETYSFDSVTIAPYMGKDSVTPFLDFENKWVVLLALTSNQGAYDFQTLKLGDHFLYEKVLQKSKSWANEDQIMYVIGATKASELENIRTIVPDNFLLVPGIGAQGGNLEEVSKYGMNKQCGLLVNSSRTIIYASENENFEIATRKAARDTQQEMQIYLDRYCV